MRELYLILFSLLCAGAVRAGDVEDADAALLKRDYATALKKYKSAALKNTPYAQYRLGDIFSEGLGVKRDFAEALRWYKMAAENGNLNAQRFLGDIYDLGQNVPQDFAESIRWRKEAAAQGDAWAQKGLGVMYWFATGVEQDYIKAHMWLNLAAANSGWIGEYREKIALKMTPQQITEAQRLARECQARNFKNCD